MRYYPIGLDISGRRCLVIGAGEVGERKAQRLLECGARVSVVGRELTPALAGLAREGRIDHIPGDYDKGLLEGAFLVIGATDDRVVNERIFRDARKRGVLANIVDDPEHCDFILPALCRQGDLVITVATGGKSPALAKKLRKELEEHYGPEYETLLKIMGELRGKIIDRGEGSDENRKLFEALVDSDILEPIRKGAVEEGREDREGHDGRRNRPSVDGGFGLRDSGFGEKRKNQPTKRPGGKKQATSKNTKSTKEVRPARP